MNPILLRAMILLGSAFASLSAAPAAISGLEAKLAAEAAGQGTSITATPEGARLHTDFQKLIGIVTHQGLRLESTGGEIGALRLTARAFGRGDSRPQDLPVEGGVTRGDNTVSFIRPGLIEEYSVSVDGVRQDFIVAESPTGEGPLVLDLALTGARARAVDDGVELTLDGSGRKLAYTRLHVVDATGRTLPASFEVAADDRLSVRVDDKDAAYPVRIDPTFSDADWVSLNPGIPGANGIVSAIAVDGSGNVYIGGDFTAVGTAAANRVAMWDGSVWTALGPGMDGRVNSLLIKNGKVYAGGQFTSAGGVAANNIAIWDGIAWSSPGSGTSGEIKTLAMIGDRVFAAGRFATAGGVTVNNIAKWDGLAWSALGSGTDSLIVSIAACGSDLYAAGFFTTAGGTEARGLAKWNGVAWSAMNDGIGYFGQIHTLAADGTDLYVGGDFAFYLDKHITGSPDSPIAFHVAKWNGSAWSILGSGTNGIVNQLAVGGGNLYAAGSFTVAGGKLATRIAKWDGSSWSAIGDGLLATPWVLAVAGDNLYIGGFPNSSRGLAPLNVAKWDNSAWSALGTGMDGIVLATAVIGNDLYIGGNFTAIGGVSANRIAKWDGSAWSPLGSGMNHDVYALQVIGTDLYAGGRFTTAGGVPAKRLAKWNGSQWTPLGPGAESNIGTMTAMGGDLYTVGSFPTLTGTTYYTVAKWDGITWTALGSGMDNVVGALAVSGSDIYAAGSFNFAGRVPAKKIAKWDGSSWSAVGAGLNSLGYASALAVNGTDLYVGGEFSTAGGVPAKCIAKWNGSEWSALGSGMTGTQSTYVSELAMNGTALYAGGQFSLAGGVPGTRNIAEWTGSEWLAFGSGVDGPVTALSVSDSSRLFIGGAFTLAGSTVSPYIVQANNLLATPLFRVWAGSIPLADGSGVPVDLESTPVGKTSSKTFTLTNDGLADLTLGPITTSGADSAEFVVGTPANTTVPRGGSTTFPVTFAPKAPGNKVASIHISGTGADNIPFDIALSGIATTLPTQPEIVVEQPAGSSLLDRSAKKSFGTVKIGKSGKATTFTIRNTGTAPLTGLAVSKSGKHQKDFTLTAPAETSLAPGASVTFTVKFKPTALKVRSASIHIRSNDADEDPFDIKIAGSGAAR